MKKKCCSGVDDGDDEDGLERLRGSSRARWTVFREYGGRAWWWSDLFVLWSNLEFQVFQDPDVVVEKEVEGDLLLGDTGRLTNVKEDNGQQSAIAKHGFGTACRSLFVWFVKCKWEKNDDGCDSKAVQLADVNHCNNLFILIVVGILDLKGNSLYWCNPTGQIPHFTSAKLFGCVLSSNLFQLSRA